MTSSNEDQIAEKVMECLCPDTNWPETDKAFIIRHLKSYGDQRAREAVKEAWGKDDLDHFRRVYNQAIEEAAKIAENTGNECLNCLDEVAEAIRALRKPEKKEYCPEPDESSDLETGCGDK